MGVWSPGPGATTGDDTFTGDASAETADGLAGADTMNGGDGADVLYGNDGNDTLDGGSAFDNDTLYGGTGDDILIPHYGEIMDGGAGNDTVTFAASTQGAYVSLGDSAAQNTYNGAGDDYVVTITHVEKLIGTAFSDTLIGGLSTTLLDGGDGDDQIYVAAGNVTISGGAGSADYLDFVGAVQGATVDLTNSANNARAAAGDVITGIEQIHGSNFNDNITGDANANIFNGSTGNDSIHGGDGDDRLFGDVGTDSLFGDNGNDTIVGGAGADALAGGAGTDTVDYSFASGSGVTVNLQTGVGAGGDAAGDTYLSIENVFGTNLDDVITGRDGVSNALFGSSGNDTIQGGIGADNLSGDDGIDTLSYANSFNGVDIRLFQNTAAGGDANGDIIFGFENIIGSSHTDTLAGDDGVNSIWGGAGNETITGRDGADFLYGDDGNDTLLGGNGDDTLQGGVGADTLGGGTGNDTADYSVSNDFVNINLQTGVGANGFAQGDTLVSIENVHGSNYDDVIVGKNNWDNVLDGGGGGDTLTGGTGDDTFVFHAGEGDGDHITDFSHTGAGNHDQLEFMGYGTEADGASFVQIDATHWQINSAGGTVHDIITIDNGVVLTSSDYVFIGGI